MNDIYPLVDDGVKIMLPHVNVKVVREIITLRVKV